MQEQLLPREITCDVTGEEIDMLVELFKGHEFTGAVWYYPGSACVDLPPPPAEKVISSEFAIKDDKVGKKRKSRQ